MAQERLRSREWLMIIAIIMLIEGLIFYAAEVHQKSVSALNYVSFAGTVTSIVLAVIAIILSVVTTYADKSTSESLKESVEALRTKIGVLDTISERIEGINQQNRIVGQKLDQIRELREFARNQRGAEETPSGRPVANSDLNAFMNSQPAATVFAAAIISLLNVKGSLADGTQIQQAFLTSELKDELSPTLVEIFKNAGQIVFNTLRFLGHITVDQERVQLHSAFIESVAHLLKAIKASDDFRFIREDAEKLIGYLQAVT